MIRVATLAAAATLTLCACSQTSAADPSAAPVTPKDFCHAMSSAAELAPAAADSLDTLLTTIDEMAVGSTDGDIDNLHAVGVATTAASESYAAALGTAASLAPSILSDDISELQEYWTLYVVGLGQVAQNAATYGSLVDQATALSTSERASTLIQDQPTVQDRVNTNYLAECSG